MSPARHRLTLLAVGLGSAIILAFVVWLSIPRTPEPPRHRNDNRGPNRSIVIDDDPPRQEPEINADTKTPNFMFIKHGVAQGMGLILEALQSNDDKRVKAALAVTHEVLDDQDFCDRYADILPAHIDGYMKVLIQQKRDNALESLAVDAMKAFRSDAAFVAICEARRKHDADKVYAAAPAPAPVQTATPGAAKAEPARLQPALDADGIPNLEYVRNDIHPSLAICTNFINNNDQPKTAKSLDLLTQIYADAQISRKDNAEIFTRIADTWARTLLKQKHYDLVEKLALQTIRKYPFDGRSVETLQEHRVRARLASGKAAEALILAKSLYNIASPGDTSRAIDIVAECLLAADPAAADAVKQFRTQQAAPNSPNAKDSILSKIKVDPSDYQAAISTAEKDFPGFDGYMAKTHLLLLADKPQEARTAVDLALKAAAGKEIPLAAETSARTLKAQDQNPSRARAALAPTPRSN
jgi:hypothetical protein